MNFGTEYPFDDPFNPDEWDGEEDTSGECPDCGADIYDDGRPCEYCGYDPLVNGI